MASITITSTSTAALSTRSGNATLRRDSGLLEQNVALESRIECEITSTFLGRDQVNVSVLGGALNRETNLSYDRALCRCDAFETSLASAILVNKTILKMVKTLANFLGKVNPSEGLASYLNRCQNRGYPSLHEFGLQLS